MRNHIIKIFIAFSFLVATITHADVFNTLNYSGRIVNSDGSPKTGSVDLEINFFASESGGSQKGTTYLFSATALTNGTFNLEIVISDSDIPTVLDSSTDTYIEVTDTTNSKIYPRQKINSVPYSQQAGGIAGYPLPAGSPSSAGQILKWNGSEWTWGADAGGSGPGTIDSTAITDGSVDTIDLANDAVDSTKIIDGTISTADLATDAVSTINIRNSAVTSAKIADGSIDTTDLAGDSVNSSKIVDGSVSGNDLAADSVTTSKIKNYAITSSKIADGTITDDDINSLAAISQSKINGLGSSLASKVNTSTTISAGTGLTGGGDLSTNRTLSLSNTGVIAQNYTRATISVDAQGRITSASSSGPASSSDIADTSITTAKLQDSSVTTAKLNDGSVSLAKIDPGSCTTNQVIKHNGTSWACASLSSIPAKYVTDHRVSYISSTKVEIRPAGDDHITVKMRDGTYYDGETSSFTVDLTTNGYLGLDTGSLSASTWYYLYAVPKVLGSTFTVMASSASPSDGGPLGPSTYKYLGAVYNMTSGGIYPFIHTSKDRFIFSHRVTNYSTSSKKLQPQQLLLRFRKLLEQLIPIIDSVLMQMAGQLGTMFIPMEIQSIPVF